VPYRGADAGLSAFAHADTLALLECWMGQSLRRQEGHVAAGVVSDSVADRKPFKPSAGVGHTKLSTTIMFRNIRV